MSTEISTPGCWVRIVKVSASNSTNVTDWLLRIIYSSGFFLSLLSKMVFYTSAILQCFCMIAQSSFTLNLMNFTFFLSSCCIHTSINDKVYAISDSSPVFLAFCQMSDNCYNLKALPPVFFFVLIVSMLFVHNDVLYHQ